MTIGPEGRKAGEQLKEARSFLATQTAEAQNQTLIIGCRNQAAVLARLNRHCQSQTQYQCYPVECVGTIHSVVYNILAAQFGRVVIASCPARNCSNKDGYLLLSERISGQREPTLLKTSLRERIQIHEVGDGEESRFLKNIQKSENSEGSQAKLFSLRKLSVIATSIGLALIVAGLTRVPAAPSPGSGLLRLSIRLVGQSEKTCQTPTSEELAKIPKHMRAAEICTYRALTYQLKLNIDGKEYLNEQVHPGGFKRDRPIYVSREIEIEAGEHEIGFSLEPLESTNPEVVRLDLRKRVEFKPGRVALIHYSPNEKKAVLKEAHHE